MKPDFTVGVAIAVVALVILALVIATILLIRNKNFKGIKKIAYNLVVQAEETFGTGTGHIKYTWVVERLYQLLPANMRKFITEDDIDDAIEWSVEKMKELLKDDETPQVNGPAED